MLGADDPGQVLRRHGGLIDYLEPLLDRRRSTLDHAQLAAFERLQQLTDDLAAFAAARKSRLKRLFGSLIVPPPRDSFKGKPRPLFWRKAVAPAAPLS